MGKCKYCRAQATRRVNNQMGPFCDMHWNSYRMAIIQWETQQLQTMRRQPES